MVSTKLLTAQDLWNLGDQGEKYELIRGELIQVSPAGGTHGAIMMTIGRLLGNYVSEHRLGRLYGGDVGFIFHNNPDTVLGPDVAFLAKERVPEDDSGYILTPPDLAIEIASPGNTAREIERKLGAYLSSGVRQVWIVYPGKRQVIVHSPSDPPRTLYADHKLTGGDILPGLSITVSSLFDD